MIIALSTIVGVTDALSMPSFQSIVPTILPRDQVARGLELNSTQYNLSRILGPAIAGGLLATVGPVACFAINAASYVPFVGVAVWILPPRAQRPVASGDPDDGRISIGSVFRADGLRTPLLTVLANAVLIAPLMTFIPVLVKHVFAGSATDFSMAVVAFGIGGLVGAAVLLALPSDVSLRAVSASAAAFDACVLLLIGMTRAFVWCVPLLALAGAGLTISNTAANSWLQTTTDRRRLGRTISLYMLALGGGSALGALATGVTVSALGVQRALMLNAVLALGAQGALLRARGDGGRS
jgi:predicted MFS family arabinose efflux permease